MATDPSIIAVMEAAVAQSPDNDALRLHLASLLREASRASDALEHCAFVLSRQPADVDALREAARCAQAAGETVRAEGYQRLCDALGGGNLPVSPPGVPPAPVSPPVPGDIDRIGLQLVGDDEPPAPFVETETPLVTLQDVAGMEAVKRRLNIAFLAPMKNPEMRKLYGKSLKGGLLLYGPPGCGKTFIARATAGELGANFLSVGLSDVMDMWLGESERKLHELFEMARRSKPCVLFFDEIDALGRKRSLMRQSASHNIVNQLLSEMDSVAANNDGVFILAATNHPWDVDTALRRPGRLDRTLLVLPPDAPAREAIFRSYLAGRPVEGVDYKGLAAKTEMFSGADITHLCEGAAELAMEDSIMSGKVRPIGQADFVRVLREVKPSVLTWFDTARNFALFANEGGAYDDLLEFLRARKML